MKIALGERTLKDLGEKGLELLTHKVDKFYINIGFDSNTGRWNYLYFLKTNDHRISMRLVSADTNSQASIKIEENAPLCISLAVEEFRQMINDET